MQHDLAKLDKAKEDDSDSDDDDDDLDDREGIKVEIAELEGENAARQAKLDEYEKNKKWNIDNMFEVKEERTVVNPTVTNYTETGFAQNTIEKPINAEEKKQESKAAAEAKDSKPAAAKQAATAPKTDSKPAPTTAGPAKPPPSKPKAAAASNATPVRSGKADSMETYHEYTEKYADLIEEFMTMRTLASSCDFLMKHGDILLQENASNYLLLASLEDEMNGYHDKMKLTARQSQIISNIAELAKAMKTHPGNVVRPFFNRLEQREHLEEFMLGVNAFVDKICKRAVTKKQEMDAQRQAEEDEQQKNATSLEDIPREERLGPGGLDPLEVIETLPADMVKAFESRNVEDLQAALLKLDPAEAERHMKRCVDSGLWCANT